MKKFRLLAATVITVVMLFTVALAADTSFDAVKYDGAADTITITVKADGDYTFDMYSAFQLKYDETVFTVDTDASAAATTDYAMTYYDYTGDYGYGCVCASNEAGILTVTNGSTLMKVVLNVVDKDAAVGKTIAWDEDGTCVYSSGAAVLFTGGVTVEAAGPATVDVEAAVDAAYTSVQGATDVYTGVWVGTATKNLEGKTLKAAKLVFGDDVKVIDGLAVKAVDGEGSVAYKIAVLGVPRVDGTMTPAYAAKLVLTVE